jgi:hypothetical protein
MHYLHFPFVFLLRLAMRNIQGITALRYVVYTLSSSARFSSFIPVAMNFFPDSHKYPELPAFRKLCCHDFARENKTGGQNRVRNLDI